MFKNKIVGIWGLGIVGKSALNFFISKKYTKLAALNNTIPENDLQEFIKNHNINYFDQKTQLKQFLTYCDYILASPGIDLRPYEHIKNKWITEADIFASFWKKPIIAITGSLGKTTITHLLSEQLSNQKIRVVTGGNIGTPMLDLIKDQNQYEIAVLELSSFQLEYVKKFSPDIAIITNLYPNHLDRHNTINEYWQAKRNIFIHQKPNQKALLPFSFKENDITKDFFKTTSTIHYFNDQTQTNNDNSCYYIDENNNISLSQTNKPNNIIIAEEIPQSSFAINWLIIAAALDLYSVKPKLIASTTLEHRLWHVAKLNKTDFYNDSKATVMEATLLAVDAFEKQSIILILGGLSKGVNREKQIKKLRNKVKYVICFGAEAEQLSKICSMIKIPNISCKNLKQAVAYTKNKAQPHDVVLLSPGGASFDLYKNYQERGNHFISLIKGSSTS